MKTKKFISLLMSLVMFISMTAGIDFSANAGGWLDDVEQIEFNTIYTESCDPTDYYDGRYHDSFEFDVELSGTVNLYIESENESFFEYGPYNSTFYIYNANDTANYLYKFWCLTAYSYDSSRGVYILNENFSLPKGTYYFVTSCTHYDYSGTYSFSLNFKPNISKPSIKTTSTNKKHKITAKWKKVSGCDGYQVQFSRKKNFKSGVTTKTVKGQKKTSCTGKFKKGKRYYVRVRAYKIVDGERYYSSWSSKKSIKCR